LAKSAATLGFSAMTRVFIKGGSGKGADDRISR
jgi:hypothetical protein